MSAYPCYPEPYPWGSPSAPASPRGWYKVLWASMDAVGMSHVYPAAYIQCLGRIIRGDNWNWNDLHLSLADLAGTFSYATRIDVSITIPGQTYRSLALDYYNSNLSAGFPAFQWAFHQVWGVPRAERWCLWLFHYISPFASPTWTDVLAKLTYVYNVAPISSLQTQTRALTVSSGSPFGAAWATLL